MRKGFVAIMVQGGLVNHVLASKDISNLLTIEVIDLDLQDYRPLNREKKRWNSLRDDKDLITVY